nr:DUF4255 domain-containing protein [Azospirillum picis]
MRDLLNDGLVNHNIAGTLGSGVTVSVAAPDRVVQPSGQEASQVNLFLYHVTPNSGWRNAMLPSRDGSGRQRLSNPPLALDLHYLLSVYSGGDLHAEILLGYAMQLLHERSVLTREMIRTALNPSPDVGAALPPALRALGDSGLEDQVELVKITAQNLNTEEISKLWTAMQSHFRPTAVYTASVVLIEATRPSHAPLPVLSRGPVDPATGRDRGITVVPHLVPPPPLLTAAVPPNRQPVAAISDTVRLEGLNLDGTGREVVLNSDRLEVEAVISALPPVSPPEPADRVVEFSLAGQAAALPAGLYRVAVRLVRPGEITPRETNRVALMIAPRMTNLPLVVPRAADGSASFTVEFTPALRAGQRATLILDSAEHEPHGGPASPASPVTECTFIVTDAPTGTHLARLRIDDVESSIVDRSAEPPTFLNQTVRFT